MASHQKICRIQRSRRLHSSSLVASAALCSIAVVPFFVNNNVKADTVSTWTSSTSGNWSNGANWQGGQAPVVDPNGDDSLEFNASGTYTANNDLGPFYVYNTTFDSTNGPTTLTGGDLDLSWPLSETNNPTFKNLSTSPVTINNNVNFECPPGVGGTTEYFVLAPGSTTTINGSIGLTGGSGLLMTNGQTSGLGGPGGTMIWTQPLVFTNSPATGYSNYFPIRIYEGTFELGGYTIDNGGSDAPILNIQGVNIIQSNVGVDNSAQTDVYIGPEDYENGHPNDVAAFYLISGGESMNQPVQIGDAGTITIGGLNTSGTVSFNDFFKTLPTDGNGSINGVSQTIYYSAAAGGTVLQNFQLVRGGASGQCTASIDKIGAGTWIVDAGGTSSAGTQAYTGTTTIRDGTLELEYDDTGTNYVTLPAAVFSNPNTTYYSNGYDGGSLGYNAATNPVQLGDTGTLLTDNIALLTLSSPNAPGPRTVLHYINVNNFNPNGTTTIGVADNGTGNFTGNILLNKTAVLTSGSGGAANFSGNITGVGGITIAGTGVVTLSGTNSYQGVTNVTSGSLDLLNISSSGANSLVADLKAGYNKGAWNGTGTGVINSSTAAASKGVATLGYIYNSSAQTFQITYTLPGDTDLNGVVNSVDLSNFTNGIGWDDFNYDGKVNADDFSLFLLGAAYGHLPTTPAPEPALALLMALPLTAVRVRKRSA